MFWSMLLISQMCENGISIIRLDQMCNRCADMKSEFIVNEATDTEGGALEALICSQFKGVQRVHLPFVREYLLWMYFLL